MKRGIAIVLAVVFCCLLVAGISSALYLTLPDCPPWIEAGVPANFEPDPAGKTMRDLEAMGKRAHEENDRYNARMRFWKSIGWHRW